MARVIPSAASSADAAIRTLAGFTSRLGKRCSISLAMCSMARLLVVWCSVCVLRVDPFGHVGNQRRVDVPGLLVLRKTRLAFNRDRSEEHTSELQSLMLISYAVFCLKKKLV